MQNLQLSHLPFSIGFSLSLISRSAASTAMDVLRGLTTSQWAALSPAISYFCGSLFFQTLETFKIGEQYRLVPTDEELKRNRVSRTAVIAHALVYHSITTTLALIFVDLFPPLKECQHCFGSYSYFETSIAALLGNKEHGSIQLAALSWLARLIYLGVRQFGAFFIFDTWLYWTHYFSHHNRWWFSKTNYPVSTTIDPTSGNSCPIHRTHPLKAPQAICSLRLRVSIQSPS